MDDINGNSFVNGLTDQTVTSEKEILELMEAGLAQRKVGVTNMNERSSRSHSIFRIVVESELPLDKPLDKNDQGRAIKVSHLNLVDLAGSERAGQAGTVGDRFREGTNINKSLMNLGKLF